MLADLDQSGALSTSDDGGSSQRDEPAGSSSIPLPDNRPEIGSGGRKRGRFTVARRNHKLWEFFKRNGADAVTCVLCEEELKTKTSSPTPLHTHLRTKHTEQYKDVLKEKIEQSQRRETEEQVIAGIGSGQDGKQQKMTQFLKRNQPVKYPKNGPKQSRIDMEIMLFIASTQQPFSLADEQGFKRLINYLDPRCTVKTSTTFSRSKCPQLHARVKEEVENVLARELENSAGVAFTCDGWTSRSNDPFQSLTLHYINQHFEMKSFLVGYRNFDGFHTGAAVASMMDEMVRGIAGLPRDAFKVCVTDSGSNMLSGVRTSKTIRSGLRCLDHTVHNAVTRALEGPEFQGVIAQCKHLASRVHRSSAVQQKIELTCASLDTPIQSKKIVTPVSTRWNSLCDCVQSIIAMKDALLKIAADEHGSELAVLIPSEEDFDQLELLSGPLLEIKKISDKLSTEKQPTIHNVLVYLYHHAKLKLSYRGKSDAVDAFIDAYFAYFEKRVPNSGRDEPMYLLGNFFHPFFKGALVNGSGSDGHLWTETISQLLSLHDSDIDSCVSDGSVSANNNDSALIGSRWDELTALADRHVEKLQRNESVNKSALEIEIDTYFQLPRSADVEGSDVLSWWKDKVISLPRLARLARFYLAIPSTSTPSERVFSCGGQIATAQRNRLDPEMIEKLVYMKVNWNKVKLDTWKFPTEEHTDSDTSECFVVEE